MGEGFEVDEMVYGPDGRAVDFRYLDVNPAWERQTGIPRAAAVGRLLSEVVPGEQHFWVGIAAGVVETGEPAHVERFIPQLGRWYEVRVHRTAVTGHFAALVMDATGRKAAEARRDALVELGDRLRDLRDAAEIAHVAAEVIGRALGALRAGDARVDADE
jgi:PAS domain S-box-containing protein